ncbi:MAG: AMP-binding protein [Alphaproteobacteria bacterium]|nr:AMP-binding protein [Alphaproteobacteria bacterium]
MSELFKLLSRHALDLGDRMALSDDRVALVYGVLPATIEETARAIDSACPGDGPVALLADNCAAWVLIDLALASRGRVAIPMPPFFSAEQREHALAEAGAAWLVAEAEDGDLAVGGRHFRACRLSPAAAALPALTAKVTFTSGTTGRPKGVCLSQAGLECVAQSLVTAIGSEYAGTHVAVLPLAVLLENVAGLYTTLLAGGHYRVLPQAHLGFGQTFVPDFRRLETALREHQANSAILVPELLRGLLRALGANGRLPEMKLLAVGGAHVAPALLRQADALGLPVYQGYGLSEAGSVVTLNTPRDNRPGSVGKILDHVGLAVSDDGELCLTDPAFLGYAGGSPAPSHYTTGDLGWVDPSGFVHLTGRKSNVLITAFGRNVSPEWIESELTAQPQIAQAFAFGEGVPALGALIVPAGDSVSDADLDAAIERVNRALPEYARIKHWAKVLPFLPGNGQLTPNGRLRRPAIAAAHDALIRAALRTRGQYKSFFDRLIAETQAEQAYLAASPQIRDGLEGRISLPTYLAYLGEAYHHVRHTVPLLERVRDLLPPSKAWLREAADSYIAEESGHDEWILDDIRNAGGDADAVRAGAPNAATELMVAYAYDFVARVNPVGFFGMVFVLEGTSTQLATRGAQAVMRSLGLGPDSFRYLTSHGAIDLSHIQFLQGLLNRVDDPQDQADIIHMAKRMFVLFANLFRSIPHAAPVQHAA